MFGLQRQGKSAKVDMLGTGVACTDADEYYSRLEDEHIVGKLLAGN
jgi:hypothetical protein